MVYKCYFFAIHTLFSFIPSYPFSGLARVKGMKGMKEENEKGMKSAEMCKRSQNSFQDSCKIIPFFYMASLLTLGQKTEYFGASKEAKGPNSKKKSSPKRKGISVKRKGMKEP